MILCCEEDEPLVQAEGQRQGWFINLHQCYKLLTRVWYILVHKELSLTFFLSLSFLPSLPPSLSLPPSAQSLSTSFFLSSVPSGKSYPNLYQLVFD